MDNINTALSVSERISIGTSYAKMLFDKYQTIESMIIYGSTVRGDCLPVSDLDMHYLVSKASTPLPLGKGVQNGVFIDIEPDFREDLSVEKVLADGYLFGLINDCVVLFDRTGFMTELKNEVSRKENPELSADRIEQLVFPISRNFGEFVKGMESMNHSEICRSSGFFMWCLSDYLLAKYRRPAGGFRTLARLKMVNTDAFLDILKLQDSMFRTERELRLFTDLSYPLPNTEKTDWMFDNGFKDDAFHALWINLGLKIKEAKLQPEVNLSMQVSERSEKWLTRLNWNQNILCKKAKEMESLIEKYVK